MVVAHSHATRLASCLPEARTNTPVACVHSPPRREAAPRARDKEMPMTRSFMPVLMVAAGLAKLDVAAKTGNVDAIKGAGADMGAACKACHDVYRKE